MAERLSRRKDDLAHAVIGMIAARNGESIDFNRLQSKLGIESRQDLLDCLQNYPHLFAVSRENGGSEIVNMILKVNLCPDYCSESNCHDIDCQMFHICKFYILSDGCLSKNNTCKYGHSLSSTHNINLFRALLLDDVPYKHLQKLFRLPRNRTRASIPRICSFFNVQAGCSKRGKCTSLHICEHYFWGNCKFGRGKCNRSHNLLDNEKILKRYGINTERNPSDILEEIKMMYDNIEQSNRDEDDSRSNDIDYDETRGLRSSLNNYTPRYEMPEFFNNLAISQPRNDTGYSLSRPSYYWQQEPQFQRQARVQQMQPRGYPIQYPSQPQRQGQHSRQRYNSAPNYTGNNTRSPCHVRSKSQRPENRSLYSKARRFGSNVDISTISKEPVICKYYMDGHCRYKNHCKNIHPPKNDPEKSDSESQGDSTSSSDED